MREEVEERKICFLHWLRTGSFIQHWNNEMHLPHCWPQLGHFMQFQQLRSSSRHKYLAKEGWFWFSKGKELQFLQITSVIERLTNLRSPPAIASEGVPMSVSVLSSQGMDVATQFTGLYLPLIWLVFLESRKSTLNRLNLCLKTHTMLLTLAQECQWAR